MNTVEQAIEELQPRFAQLKGTGLKEYPTRTVFIDPILGALGWDVRQPDVVQLEYPTIDGKSVDYAMKVGDEVVLLVEAKQLDDSLGDVKAITQTVGYAANDGIDWCVLTNGAKYQVYRSSEKASAPEKLLFEVSLIPEDEGVTVGEIAQKIRRLSRQAMEQGVLDDLGEEIFAATKVRKALRELFASAPDNFVRILRRTIGDDSIKPQRIKEALRRMGAHAVVPAPPRPSAPYGSGHKKPTSRRRPGTRETYTEADHIDRKPQEVLKLYQDVDRFSLGLAPGEVKKTYRAKTINYSMGNRIFCSVHVLQGGLRIWVKLQYSAISNPPHFVRDVSRVGHWGVGDVEVGVDNSQELEVAFDLMRRSFTSSA